MYKIEQMPYPENYVSSGYINVQPWKFCNKHHIKLDYDPDKIRSIPVVKICNQKHKLFEDGPEGCWADIYFELDMITDDIFIVDNNIWVQSINGGLAWFRVKNESEDKE